MNDRPQATASATIAARRQGLSDGYYGYPRNPGDFEGAERKAYLDGHVEGNAKNRRGKAW